MEEVDLRIQGYSSILLFGNSGSGKSRLSIDVALSRDKVFRSEHQKCIIFCRYIQPMFLEAQQADPTIVIVTSRESLEAELEENMSSLIIFDDFLSSTLYSNDNVFVSKFFYERCHHQNLSIIFQSQVLFSKNSVSWRENCSHFVIFKSSQERKVSQFFGTFPSVQSGLLEKAYKSCTDSKKYAYLFFTMHPNEHDNYRVRDSIIPRDGMRIFMRPQEKWAVSDGSE